MGAEPDTTPPVGVRRHLVHAMPTVWIAVWSGVGAVANLAFQIIAARALGPSDFGAFGAFWAIVNVALLGSGALQSAVAVSTAEHLRDGLAARPRRISGFTIEALVLGGIISAIIAALAWPLGAALGLDPALILIAIPAVLGTYFMVRYLGVVQGHGRAVTVSVWSTAVLLLRVLLLIVSVLLSWHLVGVVGAIIVSILIGVLGAWLTARPLGLGADRAPFSRSSLIVISMTLLLAVLTNVDVILVRALDSPEDAGRYAAAAGLVKIGLSLPLLLSLYLLPRFVRARGDVALTRTGLRAMLLLTAGGSLTLTAVLAVGGDWILSLLYGAAYELPSGYLPLLALAYLPWLLTQSLLARLSAVPSWWTVIVLLVTGVALVGVAVLVLPSLYAIVWVIAVTGAAAFLVLLWIESRLRRLDAARASA